MECFNLFNDRPVRTACTAKGRRSRPLRKTSALIPSNVSSSQTQPNLVFPDYFIRKDSSMSSQQLRQLSQQNAHIVTDKVSNAALRMFKRLGLKRVKNIELGCSSKEDDEPTDELLVRLSDMAMGMILLNGIMFRPREKPLQLFIWAGYNQKILKEAFSRRPYWKCNQVFNSKVASEVNLCWLSMRTKRIATNKCTNVGGTTTKQQKIQLANRNPCMRQVLMMSSENCEVCGEIALLKEDCPQFVQAHLPNSQCLTNTKELWQLLENSNCTHILPKCLIYHRNLLEIRRLLYDCRALSSKKLLAKCCGSENRFDKYMIIENDPNHLLAVVQKCRMGQTLIFQEVRETAKFQGKKLSFNSYLLITIVKGIVRAYCYRQGYVQMSMKDTCLKVGFSSAQKYFSVEAYQKIQQSIYQSCHSLAKATANSLNSIDQSVSFEVFRLKFIITADHKLLLEEIIDEPRLEAFDEDGSNQSENLVESLLQTAVDPIFMPPLNHRDKMQSVVEKFKMVYEQCY